MCRLQAGDINLLHSQHCLRHAVRLLCIWIVHKLLQTLWGNLPRQAVLVFQPAAGTGFATIGHKCFPVVVDLLLRIDCNDKRYSLSEFLVAIWATIQHHEVLAAYGESAGHYLAFWSRHVVAESRDFAKF